MTESGTLDAITFNLLGSGVSVPVVYQLYALSSAVPANLGTQIVGALLASLSATTNAGPLGTPLVPQSVATGGWNITPGRYLAIMRPLSGTNMSIATLRTGSSYPGGDWTRVNSAGDPASLTGRSALFSQSYDLLFALRVGVASSPIPVSPVPLASALPMLAAALSALVLLRLRLGWPEAERERAPEGARFIVVSSANGRPSCPWRSRASWRAAFPRPSRSGARRCGDGWP